MQFFLPLTVLPLSILLIFYLYLLVNPRYIYRPKWYRQGFWGMFAIFGAQAFGLVLLVFQVAHPTWGALLGLITVVATLWALAMAFLACYHGPTHDITGSTLKDALEDTGVRPSYRNDDDDVYEPTAEVVNEDPKPSPPPAPPTRPTSPNGGITRPPKQ